MHMFGQCCVQGATLRGVDALPVDVEVVVSAGLPGFMVVGMPDAAIQEARERVRAALRASGFSMPNEKVVVNLAPGSLRKTGSGFDLPIAVGILAATGQIDRSLTEGRLYAGELSMEGCVRPVAGLLAYAIAARGLGCDFVCGPSDDFVGVAGVRQLVAGSSSEPCLEYSNAGKARSTSRTLPATRLRSVRFKSLRREIMACS